jgi:hypothetical protein
MLATASALIICACSAGGPKPAALPPPPPTWLGAEQLMLRADDAMRHALDHPSGDGLAEAFRGPALQILESQAATMAVRGLRDEERSPARTLVFWDPRAREAVLQVVAQHRLLAPDQPNPAWVATARQWWARLQYAEGSWWVVDQEDLTPDRWRDVPPNGP